MDEKLIAKNFIEKLIGAGVITNIENACEKYKTAISLLRESPDKELSNEELSEKIKELVSRYPEVLKELFKESPELFK